MPACSKCKDDVNFTYVKQHLFEIDEIPYLRQYDFMSNKTIEEIYGTECIKKTYYDICDKCFRKIINNARSKIMRN